MKGQKPAKLPRGLRRRPDSPFLYFSWRDSRGKQHQQSTETDDPAKAVANKFEFLRKQREEREDLEVQANDMGGMPLARVAELYFNWKTAVNAEETVAKERRIFRPVLKFFSPSLPIRKITLPLIREYQQKRRLHGSKTMKQPVTGHSVNYEMGLLRSMMIFADCWTESLAARYKPLRHIKKRAGQVADKAQLMEIIRRAKANEYWHVAMYCAAVAAGSGCRGGEIRKLQLKDIQLERGKVVVRREIAKNRIQREPRLMALADWGLRHLLLRAQALGATEPEHVLLPLNLRKEKHARAHSEAKWDVNRPMTGWARSWRKLMDACGMHGFRFRDLRHTFRTLGAEAGVPLEVMMAQLGHMDRQTSLEYVHIQQRAFERAKQLIEIQQEEVLATAEGRPVMRRAVRARHSRQNLGSSRRWSHRFHLRPGRRTLPGRLVSQTVRRELPPLLQARVTEIPVSEARHELPPNISGSVQQ